LAAILPLADPLLFVADYQVHQVARQKLRNPTSDTSVVPEGHRLGFRRERATKDQPVYFFSILLIKIFT